MKQVISNVIKISSIFSTIMLTGCFAGKSLPQQQYLLTLNQQNKICRTPTKKSIEIAPYAVVSPFASQQFMYRLTDIRWQPDYYHVFLTPIDIQLTKATIQTLASSHCWQAVGNEWQPLAQSNYVLSGMIRALYADYHHSQNPRAVMLVDYQLRDTVSGKVIWHRSYQQNMRLKEKSTEALVRAWSTEANYILTRLVHDLPK